MLQWHPTKMETCASSFHLVHNACKNATALPQVSVYARTISVILSDEDAFKLMTAVTEEERKLDFPCPCLIKQYVT